MPDEKDAASGAQNDAPTEAEVEAAFKRIEDNQRMIDEDLKGLQKGIERLNRLADRAGSVRP
jgi:hypothetical protein